MRMGIVCFSIVALPALLSARLADDQGKKEAQAALQGGWKVTALEVDGKESELPDVSLWWVIKGDKVYYGGQELAKLSLDPTTTPRCLDLTFRKPERTCEGIYVLDKDTLKICINRTSEGVKERPGKFSTEGKGEWRLLTFKRDKDRKVDDLDGLGGFVGLALNKELVVMSVLEGSPAMKAGLKKDDVLLKVGDQEAKELLPTVKLIRGIKPGSDLKLRIKRGEKEQELLVKVGVAPFFLLD